MSLVLNIKWKGLGFCPVVIDDDGHIIREVAEWLASRQPLCSPSSLTKKASGLARFDDFWRRYGATFEGDDLLYKFWNAMIDGDPTLCWKPVQDIATARYALRTVNEFTDWVAMRKNLPNPNPPQDRRLTWIQRSAEFSRRLKTDLLAHLFSSTRQGMGTRQGRSVEPETRTLRRGTPYICRPTDVFELKNFVKLVEEETNPRNLALWLLLGGGGPRTSEALHLFSTDVRVDEDTSEARVCLGDPQRGIMNVKVGGIDVRMTRKQFLQEQYGLVPRDLLNPHGRQYLGWKGMLIQERETKSSEITWLGDYGKLMWLASRAYWRLVLQSFQRLPHPWFFINLQRNAGAFLTEGNAKQVFGNACRRHGFPPPHNLHSLRHMYMDILVNVLHIPLHNAQILIRHRCRESTELYARSSLGVLQSQVSQAAGKLPTLRLSLPTQS
jgi:hypothetical protein